MQVLADVDEADVGQLSPDSKVSFTVDAFPTETFEGTIDQIRRPASDVNGRIQIDAPLFLNANRSPVCRCARSMAQFGGRDATAGVPFLSSPKRLW